MANILHTAAWMAALTNDIYHAKRSVRITALSINPPRDHQGSPLAMFWHALSVQKRDGIQVEIITQAPSKNHPATLWNQNAAQYAAFLGIPFTFHPMPRLLHAKTVLIDEQIAWIGSGNFTAAAASHNEEAYLRTDDPATAAALFDFHGKLILNTEGLTR